jgi:hypothetical protein
MAMTPPTSFPPASPSSYFNNMSAGFLDSPILLTPSVSTDATPKWMPTYVGG